MYEKPGDFGEICLKPIYAEAFRLHKPIKNLGIPP